MRSSPCFKLGRTAYLIATAKFVITVRGFTDVEDPMLCLDLKLDFLPGKPKFMQW